MKKIIYPIIIIGILIIAIAFFSFRLTDSPQGMTGDESSIGYNAILISKTLRDETGRLLPIFTLTMNGADWKQPVSIYSTAIIFKIFGASLFNLKFVNVIVAVLSLLVIILINYNLLGKRAGIISGVLFMVTPTILMHSHLAQENIMPVLFTSLWLLFILLFQKKSKTIYLILAGISLGIDIYCYKGMRALVPPLVIITEIYLYLSNNKKFREVILFSLGLSPFIFVMPWINTHYAGALFDNQKFVFHKYYDFFYPYLSSFDITGLFIKGDVTAWHSTGLHGVFLLSTLPLFVIGLILAYKNTKFNHYYLFLLVSFILCPILLGQVGSVYRFSRLLIFVPFYVAFTTLCFENLLKMPYGKIFSSIIFVVILLNFIDFANYYWYSYPKIQKDNFSENNDVSYKRLSKIAKEKKFYPYVYQDEYQSQGDNSRFYEAAYFENKLGQWKPGLKVERNSILMTKLEMQPGFILLEKVENMNLLISQ